MKITIFGILDLDVFGVGEGSLLLRGGSLAFFQKLGEQKSCKKSLKKNEKTTVF